MTDPVETLATLIGRGRRPAAPVFLNLAILLTSGFGAAPPGSTDGGPLSVADLAGYRAALTARGDEPAVAVGFRALWAAPGSYQGKRVRVEGRVVRRFSQGAFGTFPPLEEAWMVTPAGDPFCVVYPRETVGPAPALGGPVQFAGTFLKRVRYEGGDGPRLAPLIVGDRPPTAPATTPISIHSRSGSVLDWTIGLVVAAVVVTVLAARHLRRPVRRPLDVEVAGPPPEFLQPGGSP